MEIMLLRRRPRRIGREDGPGCRGVMPEYEPVPSGR